MKSIISIFALLIIASNTFAQGYRVNRTEEKKKVNVKNAGLGKNIFTFVPAQVNAMDIMNEDPDVCIGFSYERIMDNEMISVKLPITSSLTNNFYYFMPQVKFYPKKQGISKYAVGPQFLFGMGDIEYTKYIQTSTGSYYQKNVLETRSQYGFMINNSLNFTFSKSIYIGMEVALGLKFYDSHSNVNNNFNGSIFSGSGDVPQIFQANFNMGYRF